MRSSSPSRNALTLVAAVLAALCGCRGADACIGLCVRLRTEVAACNRVCPDPWSDPACTQIQTPDPFGHCAAGLLCDTPLADAGFSCDLVGN